jgi:hypothetical protein
VTLTFDLLTPKSMGVFYIIRAITLWSLNALGQTVLQLLRGNEVWQTNRKTGQKQYVSPRGGGDIIMHWLLYIISLQTSALYWQYLFLREQRLLELVPVNSVIKPAPQNLHQNCPVWSWVISKRAWYTIVDCIVKVLSNWASLCENKSVLQYCGDTIFAVV